MKGKIYKKGLAVLLGLTLAANLPVTSPLSIHMLDSYAYTGAATVKASSLNVRSDAGTGYSAVARLAAGASIQITGEKKGTDGKTWYRIQYTGSNGQAGTGYVSAAYIRLPVSYSTDASFESYLTSQGFPESYKDGLRQLHARNPTRPGCVRSMPSIQTGYSGRKIQGSTGIRPLKMSRSWVETWLQQEAFLPGNP